MGFNEIFADIVSYAPNMASVTDSDDACTAKKKLSK